jgi:hypothetical protein
MLALAQLCTVDPPKPAKKSTRVTRRHPGSLFCRPVGSKKCDPHGRQQLRRKHDLTLHTRGTFARRVQGAQWQPCCSAPRALCSRRVTPRLRQTRRRLILGNSPASCALRAAASLHRRLEHESTARETAARDAVVAQNSVPTNSPMALGAVRLEYAAAWKAPARRRGLCEMP